MRDEIKGYLLTCLVVVAVIMLVAILYPVGVHSEQAREILGGSVSARNEWNWSSPGGVVTGAAQNLGQPVCKHYVQIDGSWVTQPTSAQTVFKCSNDGVNYVAVNTQTSTAFPDAYQAVNYCCQYINMQYATFGNVHNGITRARVTSGGN